MSILMIVFIITIIALVVAFIYEIKFTYRDAGFWKK